MYRRRCRSDANCRSPAKCQETSPRYYGCVAPCKTHEDCGWALEIGDYCYKGKCVGCTNGSHCVKQAGGGTICRPTVGFFFHGCYGR